MERLNALLPARYLAGCHVHLGRRVEANVAEFDAAFVQAVSGNGEGGVATATWAPRSPPTSCQPSSPTTSRAG